VTSAGSTTHSLSLSEASSALERHATVLAAFWQPYCFLAAMVWPGLAQVARAHPELCAVRVTLTPGEALPPAWRIRFFPALVLFVDGKPRKRWFSGDIPWSAVEAALCAANGAR
jgi:thiol-disulfide isomerase/thioredoxin